MLCAVIGRFLTDHACILKTHVFTQHWCDIDIVVFIIKSPHLAYSADNRQNSTSAVLTIGTIGHRNNKLHCTVKLYPKHSSAAEVLKIAEARSSKGHQTNAMIFQ